MLVYLCIVCSFFQLVGEFLAFYFSFSSHSIIGQILNKQLQVGGTQLCQERDYMYNFFHWHRSLFLRKFYFGYGEDFRSFTPLFVQHKTLRINSFFAQSFIHLVTLPPSVFTSGTLIDPV